MVGIVCWSFRQKLYFYVKRLFDILVSLTAIILLFPIMIIIGIAIKLDSNGPIIFKQPRTGRFGNVFNVWKFRTMVVSNDVRDFSKEDKHKYAYYDEAKKELTNQEVEEFKKKMGFI